jgi:hypothetical protein
VLDTLPIDSTGWIPLACTPYDIQGAWYCFDDGKTMTSCMPGKAPYKSGGMCLSGTALGPVDGAWGGGIGVGLNESGGVNSVKKAYDATAQNIVGFSVEISGDTGGNELRVGFTGAAMPSGPSPFVPVPGPGKYDVMFADALVPKNWMVPNAGATPDPKSIFDVQVQIASDKAAPFDFCITKLTPIVSGSASSSSGGPGMMLTPYGQDNCDAFGTITLPGQYLIHNNVWNPAVPAGAQCTGALWDQNDDAAGFVAKPNFDTNSGIPGSYPSIIYGWHYNYPVPAPYKTPKQVSAVSSIPSTWKYDVPASGQYDVSYDMWVNPQQGPANPNGGLEVMVWTATRDAQPIGANQNYTFNANGADWEVWYGSPGSWNTVTFRRVTNASSVDMDLLPFVAHAVQKGWAQNNWYMLSVEAGFEIWKGSSPMTTTYYKVAVN